MTPPKKNTTAASRTARVPHSDELTVIGAKSTSHYPKPLPNLDDSSIIFLWEAGYSAGITECLLSMGADQDKAVAEGTRLARDVVRNQDYAHEVAEALRDALRTFQDENRHRDRL